MISRCLHLGGFFTFPAKEPLFRPNVERGGNLGGLCSLVISLFSASHARHSLMLKASRLGGLLVG